MKQKLTSRKLWTAVIGVVSGIALAATGNIAAGTSTIIASVLGYMITEGYIDAQTVNTVTTIVKEVEKQLDNDEEKGEE